MQETTTNQAATPFALEKPWEELSADEKIDRMRGIIKQLQTHLASAQEEIEIMKNHEHDKDNKIVFRIPIAESWKLRKNGIGHAIAGALKGSSWF